MTLKPPRPWAWINSFSIIHHTYRCECFMAGCRKGFRVWYSIGQRTISIAKLGFDVKGSSSFIWYPHRRFQMASRILILVLQMLMKPVYRLLDFMILYFVGLCYFLFHFHISIQSTETALTAMQITIWSSCNGRTSKKRAIGLMYTIRLEK
jgi:hypothetical protein